MKKTLMALSVAVAALSAQGLEAKTLKWAFQGDAQSLDPQSLNETFTLGLLGNIYEGLVRRGPDLAIEPALATSWKIVEPKRWRFTLRKGVTFHNGNAFTADDVVFTVDFRSPDLSVIEDMEKRLREDGQKIADDMGLQIEFEKVGGFDPVEFDKDCVQAIRDAAERLGYSHQNIISGAGHDACWINQVAPTAMVMCPCVDGLSHNEAEEISREWATAGADVLFHAVVETAGIVE